MYIYLEFKMPRKNFSSNELQDPEKLLRDDYSHINVVFEKLLLRGILGNDQRGVGRLVISDLLTEPEQTDIKNKSIAALSNFSVFELSVTQAKDLYNSLTGATSTVNGNDIINLLPTSAEI